MPQQTKIFRVFVSSTFTDMKEERSILQKKVFPQLEKFCEEKGAKFQAVDLRWGVNEESQRNQNTLAICLNEIERCQKISPKPNFLVLLGDRYGWQPIPSIIPQAEMDPIKTVLEVKEKPIIELWYKLDDNAIPAEYVLQPRQEKYEDYAIWEHVESEIRTILRTAVMKLSFSPRQMKKYFASATHQEILNGALNPPDNSEPVNKHVLAMVRNIEEMPTDSSADKYFDMIGGTIDEYCKTQLDNLKSEIKDTLGKNCKTYDASWKSDHSEIVKPNEFETTVFSFLKDIIEEEINAIITMDEVEHEARLHKEFKERLTEHFRGRESILAAIDTYLNNLDRKPLSMIGESGSGKSSVIAQAILNWQTKRKAKLNLLNDVDASVIFRFIGTTSSSSNIISLLQNVCKEISHKFGVDLMTLAGENKDKVLFEMNGLTDLLRKCLALGSAEQPIVIFLDALDQLSDTDNAKALYWIPREFPEHAKVIVSALPELEPKLQNTSIIHLPLLPREDAESILTKWFYAVKRQLTVDQRAEVMHKFNQTQLPIYLKLAFERAKHWHSYEKKFVLSEEVKGVINDFIDGIIKDGHDADFVEHVICYMLCGRYQGLAENEILEILAFDEEYWALFLRKSHADHRQELIDHKAELEAEDNPNKGSMKIPIVVWSRVFLDMEPFLTERDADGVPIIAFFHRLFNEVLRERYGLDDENSESLKGQDNGPNGMRYHTKLSEYFSAKKFYLDEASNRPNFRMITEGPYQLLKSRQVRQVADFITKVTYRTILIKHKKFFDLVNMFKEGFNLAIQLNETACVIRIGQVKILSAIESENLLNEEILSLLNSYSTDYEKLDMLFHNKLNEDLAKAYELLCLSKLDSFDLNINLNPIIEKLHKFNEKTSRTYCPGPLAILLIEKYFDRFYRVDYNLLSINKWSYKEQINFLCDLASIANSFKKTTIFIEKYLDKLNDTEFDNTGVFRSEAMMVKIYLMIESRQWGKLCEVLLSFRNAIKLMHFQLIWINRRLDRMGKIAKHKDHNIIYHALHKCWQTSRKYSSQGAQIAIELILLSKHLIPNSGLAEIIENDFEHRLKRSRKDHHKALILANWAKLKYLQGSNVDADSKLTEAYKFWKSNIYFQCYFIELIARYKGTIAAAVLIDSYVKEENFDNQFLNKVAWRLFCLRLLEDTNKITGVEWNIWLSCLFHIRGMRDPESVNRFNKKMLLFTIIFSTVAKPFFPELKENKPELFFEAVRTIHNEIKNDNEYDTLVENFFKNDFCDDSNHCLIGLFKTSRNMELIDLRAILYDLMDFEILPRDLIPIICLLPENKTCYNSKRGPWLLVDSLIVSTLKDVQDQVSKWKRKLEVELTTSLNKQTLNSSDNLDSKIAIHELTEIFNKKDDCTEELNKILSIFDDLCNAGTIFDAYRLYFLVFINLPQRNRIVEMIENGYPIDLLMNKNKFNNNLFTWWKDCPKNPVTRNKLCYSIELSFGTWWSWTALSTDLPEFLITIASEGEFEVINSLLAGLPRPQMLIDEDDVSLGIAHLLLEICKIEARIKRNIPLEFYDLRNKIKILQNLFQKAVNETYMKPYLAFWRLIILYEELENLPQIQEILDFVIVHTYENIRDESSQVWFSRGLARNFLMSRRNVVPNWVEKFASFKGSDEVWFLINKIMEINSVTKVSTENYEGNDYYKENLIEILSNLWHGGHISSIAKYCEKHLRYTDNERIIKAVLPVLIRSKSTLTENLLMKLLKSNYQDRTKNYLSNLLAEMIRLNDKEGITKLTAYLYKFDEYFSLAILLSLTRF